MGTPTLCCLSNEESLENFLMESTGVSRQRLKKSNLSKNYLKSNLKSRQELFLPTSLLNAGMISADYQGAPVEILYEDDLILAVNKPGQIHCHPLSYDEHDNLLSGLRSMKKFDVLRVNSDQYDRGLLHRLDFETSGVVLLAKNDDIYKAAREHAEFMKKKEYFCLVEGHFEEGEEHMHFLKASGAKGSKQIVVEDSPHRAFMRTKLAHYNEEKNVSLVWVELVTGIRHQIRVQMSALGYPLIGDTFYGGCEAPRLFLHSYHYSFLVNQQIYNVTAERAPLFLDFLNLDSGLEVLGDKRLIR